MEEDILRVIENSKQSGIKLEDVIGKFKSINEEEIEYEVSLLEKEGKIYKNCNGYYIVLDKDLKISTLYCSHKGRRYVTDNNNIFFVDSKDINGALDFDKVIFRPNEKNKTARVEKIIERQNDIVVAEVISTTNGKILSTINTPEKVNIHIRQGELEKYYDGDRLVVNVESYSTPNEIKGKIIEKLGNKKEPNIEEVTIAASRGFTTKYSKEYLDELAAIPDKVTDEDIKGRLDLRNDVIFTIDSESTKDMDDAISIKVLDNGNYQLGVHIANVSHYIKKGSVIYEDAIKRGNSAYFANSVIPMLHFDISNGICSLNEDVDRLTKSCIMEINKKGKVVNYYITDSVIHSKKKMTYEDINKIFEDGVIISEYLPYYDSLKILKELTTILKEKHEKDGYIAFASNEIKTIVDNNDETLEFKNVHQGIGQEMVEYSMIAANETVAGHVFWMRLPFIYRIHNEPREKRIEEAMEIAKKIGYRFSKIKDMGGSHLLQQVIKQLSVKEEFQALSQFFVKTMPRALYSTENIGHFALALDFYTHFTSPIRRGCDLIVHELLDLYDKDISYVNFEELEDELAIISEHISYTERQADMVEYEINALRMVKYMRENIGKTYKARIHDITPLNVQIVLENNVIGTVPIDFVGGGGFYYMDASKSLKRGKSTYCIGNNVICTVINTDEEDRTVICSIDRNLTREHTKQKIKKL
ncbi:MAG: VacB/RNase II family 3'-5' exoribonuclease [Bacilli bacterium]|nr:VacB/RNase II family 3'-5' exoribonuclease [Bacilli bacterium]